MRSSDAYTGAVARAKASPEVIEAIGSPVQEGIFFTGQINVSESSGGAILAIPIGGPKAKATIHVSARKSEGRWHYNRLIVQLQDGRQLDISDK
jgi:hypothetical protein